MIASYDIAKDGEVVAVLTLIKSTFRLGESILGVVTFNRPASERRVLKVSHCGWTLLTVVLCLSRITRNHPRKSPAPFPLFVRPLTPTPLDPPARGTSDGIRGADFSTFILTRCTLGSHSSVLTSSRRGRAQRRTGMAGQALFPRFLPSQTQSTQLGREG